MLRDSLGHKGEGMSQQTYIVNFSGASGID